MRVISRIRHVPITGLFYLRITHSRHHNLQVTRWLLETPHSRTLDPTALILCIWPATRAQGSPLREYSLIGFIRHILDPRAFSTPDPTRTSVGSGKLHVNSQILAIIDITTHAHNDHCTCCAFSHKDPAHAVAHACN